MSVLPPPPQPSAPSDWWKATPSSAYGNDVGWWGNYHDIERGNVYGEAPGTALGLPVAATYDPAYSTQYSAVYDLPGGGALNFMHIDNLLYGLTTPVLEPQGYVFAKDNPMPGAYSGTTVTGLPHSFVQTPGATVVEFGVYDTPADAFGRDNGGDINPARWPGIFARAGASSGNPGSSSGNPVGDALQFVTGIPGDIGGAVGSAAGNVAQAGLSPGESFVSRLGLTALFGAVAVGILFILLDHASGGKLSDAASEAAIAAA